MASEQSAGKKIRLDEYLINHGYFDSLKVAHGWIMSGKVVVAGEVVAKPGFRIGRNTPLSVRGLNLQYASKGGYKLARALKKFQIDVNQRSCLDAGASTGGFTDCLLQAGATRVYAVEVGYGQLRGSLAANPNVCSMERTNISDVQVSDLNQPITLAVADLSYLSLTKALPILRKLFIGDQYEIVFLIKPLYEGLVQSGIADLISIEPILTRLFQNLADLGFTVTDVCVSPISGGRGAIEFLGRVQNTGTADSPIALSTQAIEDARQSPPKAIEDYLRTDSPGSI